MIREHERHYSLILLLMDVVVTFLSYGLTSIFYVEIVSFLSTGLTGSAIPYPVLYWNNTLSILPFLVAIFMLFFQFSFNRVYIASKRFVDFVLQTTLPCLVALVIYLVLVFISHGFYVSSWFIGSFVFMLWLLLAACRAVFYGFLSYLNRKEKLERFVLIVGVNDEALRVAELFDSNRQWGIKVVGFLTYDLKEAGERHGGFEILGTVDDLMAVLEKKVVDFVFLAQEPQDFGQIQNLSLRCKTVGIDFVIDTTILQQEVKNISVDYIKGNSFILFKSVWFNPDKLFLKRLFDLATSTLLIIIFFPLWVIIPFLIKRDSPGPAFYVQERVGRNGRLFPMYKFRTMVVGAEKMHASVAHLNEMDGPVFKIKDDPRLTHIGKLLRRTSLDELPQLLNVFIGDMSLVGPRPPIMKEVLQYRPWQRKRLSVIPGVTCLWQVSGRNEIKFDEWMKLDIQYIENWSLLLDIKIIFMTVKAVILRKGAM